MDGDARYWLAGELADSKDGHDAGGIFYTAKEAAGGKNLSVPTTDKLAGGADPFRTPVTAMGACRGARRLVLHAAGRDLHCAMPVGPGLARV